MTGLYPAVCCCSQDEENDMIQLDHNADDVTTTSTGRAHCKQFYKVYAVLFLVVAAVCVSIGLGVGLQGPHQGKPGSTALPRKTVGNGTTQSPSTTLSPSTAHPPMTAQVPSTKTHYTPIPGNWTLARFSEKPAAVPDYVWNILLKMSETDPCRDFYKYACGRWLTENHPSTVWDYRNFFQKNRDEIRNILYYSLSNKKNTQKSEAVVKAKRLFTSCMDIDTITSRSSTPLRTLLTDIGVIGVKGARSVKPAIIDLLIKTAKYRRSPIAIIDVGKDDKNTSRNVIFMDQPYLNLLYLDVGTDEYRGYMAYINTVRRLLNEDQYGLGTDVLGNVPELIDFQYQLTRLTTRSKDRPPYEARYHRYTLGALNQNFPLFDWKRYIKGMFSDPEINIKLADDEPVVVYAPNYFRRVGSLLRRSRQSAVYDYIQWIMIIGLLPYLPDTYRDAPNQLNLIAFNYTITEDRWKMCTRLVDEEMSNVTGRLFIDREFDPVAIDVTKEMVSDIREAFRERMEGDSWMDTQTKARALKKLAAMGEIIGHPPEILNNTLLDQQYEDLTISDNFFEDMMAVTKRKHFRRLRAVHQHTLRTEWLYGATTVNAFHVYESNVIVIPAGILRKPFFSLDYPKSVMYARLGTILAHEMTHGFDNTGRKYGADGSLVDWWSPSALQTYRQKTTCYDRQYSSYHIDDITSKSMNVNGTLTLGENIADNGGIRDAYKAYNGWLSRQTTYVPPIPYLGLSHNQMFYLAFSQVWCETRGENKAMQMARDEPHSPGAIRVKGTLQNSNHFAQTYSCQAGTGMNPSYRQKCRIW